jgi:hypothetical protein
MNMTTSTKIDSYDEIKGMLNKIRQIQSLPKYGIIKEQEEFGAQKQNIPPSPETKTGSEDNDFAVINNVEIEIHSEDPEDLELSDEEKGKISQLIDDCRTDVSETVSFGKLHIYPTSAKLDGKISDMGLGFIFSTGDDTGFYLSNTSLLKIDENSFEMINKLRMFEEKFSNSINDLLVNRRDS